MSEIIVTCYKVMSINWYLIYHSGHEWMIIDRDIDWCLYNLYHQST